MPYSIRKIRGGKWRVINAITGRKIGDHDTRESAKAQIRAIGWRKHFRK